MASAAEPQSKSSRWQPSWHSLRWAAPAGLALVGVGLIASQNFSSTPLPGAEPIPVSTGNLLKGPTAQGNDSGSFEDALKSLEGEDPAKAKHDDGDFFHIHSGGYDVVEAHAPNGDSAKPRKKAKKVSKERKGAEEQSDLPSDNAKDTLKMLAERMLSSESASEDEKEKAKQILAGLDAYESAGAEDAEPDELQDTLKNIMGKQEDDTPPSKKKGKKKSKKEVKKQPEKEEEEADDDSHMNFIKLLKEEQERQHEHTFDKVKQEFQEDYKSDAKSLLCQGCKLVAARLHSELDTHDVHEAESPYHMLAAKRKALDATCSSFRHLHVASGVHGLKFEAGDAEADAPGTPGAPQRLCTALLEETRFDAMQRLIQSKIPQGPFGVASPAKMNWERWLCSQRMKVCKRSEVHDDDEEQEL